ncbi:MAG: hypothetical protein LUI12_01510 [Clostridiales bacterium]|nr:hypothetical protein [Clostridiales bacterium]
MKNSSESSASTPYAYFRQGTGGYIQAVHRLPIILAIIGTLKPVGVAPVHNVGSVFITMLIKLLPEQLK